MEWKYDIKSGAKVNLASKHICYIYSQTCLRQTLSTNPISLGLLWSLWHHNSCERKLSRIRKWHVVVNKLRHSLSPSWNSSQKENYFSGGFSYRPWRERNNFRSQRMVWSRRSPPRGSLKYRTIIQADIVLSTEKRHPWGFCFSATFTCGKCELKHEMSNAGDLVLR